MDFPIFRNLSTLAICGLISACAHQDLNQQLDSKLAQEPEITNHNELKLEITSLIEKSKTLTPEQKGKLLKLQTETQSKMDELRTHSLKLRALLVQEIAQKDYNENKVDLIKQQLKKTETDQLTLLFSAIDRANLVMGNHSDEAQGIMRALAEGHQLSR